MALVYCPECGNAISDKARVCIHCGCPIADAKKEGIVRIKMPGNVVEGWAGLFASRSAIIRDSEGEILWEGKHGENAKIELHEETKITIDLGGMANTVEGIVQPNCKYALVQDRGVHWLATYRLTEVDVIDSE